MKKRTRLTGFGIMLLLALCMLCFPASAGSISLKNDGSVVVDYYQRYIQYDGTAKKPVIHTVTFYKNGNLNNPTELQEGRDYVLSYMYNINPGVGWVYINGVGNYCDTAEDFFYIYRFSPAKGKVVLSKAASTGFNTVGIGVKLNTYNHKSSYMFLLRSKSPSGPFQLYDCGPESGGRKDNGDLYWTHEGTYQRAVWYTVDEDIMEDTGEPIIEAKADTDAVWYYKVVVVEPTSTSSYDGLTGYESNVVSAKAELSVPKIGHAYASTGLKKARLTWSWVEGSSGYEVYRKNNAGWEKVQTTGRNKRSFTDKKIQRGNEYRYKVRAFRKDQGRTFYSDFSKEAVVRAKASKVKGDYKKGTTYGNSSSRLKELRQAVQGFMTNHIRPGMETWEKVEQAYLFIRSVSGYGMKNGFHTAWGALVNGSATCYGYSKALKCLCDAMRIPCRFVRANHRAFNPSHAWNMVKVEGKWYIVDVQGGFFLLSGKDYRGATGMNWNRKQYPACSSTSHREAYASGSE